MSLEAIIKHLIAFCSNSKQFNADFKFEQQWMNLHLSMTTFSQALQI